MHTRQHWVRLGALMALASCSNKAWAAGMQEDMARNETVGTRVRAELDPQGVPLAGLLLFPQVSVEQKYNDNIYATATSPKADLMTSAVGQIALRSNWNNDLYGLTVNETAGFYAEHASEDYLDYSAVATGRQDITRDEYLTERLGFLKNHDDRGSPDDVLGKTPTNSTDRQAGVRYFNKLNRLSFGVDAGADTYDYSDVVSSLGTVIDNKDRNRTDVKLTGRFAYELLSDFETYVQTTLSDIRYAHPLDSSGYRRSSRGTDTEMGITLDLGGITFGDIGVGYLSQRYDDSRFAAVSGLSANAALTWNATPLITAKLSGSRALQQTVVVGSPGYIASSVTMTVDHELLRNLVLSTMVSEQTNNYINVGRQDSIFSATFGATYKMRRGLDLSLKCGRKSQDSTAPTNAFKQDTIQLKISLEM